MTGFLVTRLNYVMQSHNVYIPFPLGDTVEMWNLIVSVPRHCFFIFEPRHDKTNKMTVRP